MAIIEFECPRCGAKWGTSRDTDDALCPTCRRDDQWEAQGMPLCVDCGVRRVGPKHHAAGGNDCERCWREKAAKVRRTARVHIDAETHADVYDAVVSDDTWNGWTCPTFDLENARRLEAALRVRVGGLDEEYIRFLWTTDRNGTINLVLGESDGGDEWYWYPCGDEEVGFPIGAYGWCWSELDEDAPREPGALDMWLKEGAEASSRYCQVWNTALRAAYDLGCESGEAAAAAQRAVEDRAHYIDTGEE